MDIAIHIILTDHTTTQLFVMALCVFIVVGFGILAWAYKNLIEDDDSDI